MCLRVGVFFYSFETNAEKLDIVRFLSLLSMNTMVIDVLLLHFLFQRNE